MRRRYDHTTDHTTDRTAEPVTACAGGGRVSVTGTDVVAVDERDSSWQDHSPRFRVYLFHSGDRPGSSWATDTYDATGADALEVIDWTREHAGDDLLAVALVRDDLNRMSEGARGGLVRLIGHDANGRPASETQQHLADRMHTRQTRSR